MESLAAVQSQPVKLGADDPYVRRGYAQERIEPGERPAVLVVDLQHLHTDHASPLAGAPLIDRAVESTAPVLAVAREAGVPVFHMVVCWNGDLELGMWRHKLPFLAECTPGSHWAQVDARLWDQSDVLLPKKRPSFFHGTPLHSLLTYARCDTVVVTGATTSGCVRATIVDAFSNNFRTIVPEDCVGDHEQGPHEANLRDVHRRYAEVTTSDEVLAYLAALAVPA
jgi:maleamate amidohydrolase